MTRFNNDQNKVVLIHESGTYAFASGNAQWIGQVKSNDVTDEEGKIVERFMGTTGRSFDSIDLGPRDITGTISYTPQDMRIPAFAIGSVVDSGTSVSLAFHKVTEINTNVWQNAYISGTGQYTTPPSFTLEDSKTSSIGVDKNVIRTVRGCIPNVTKITATQGEKVMVDCDYIGQTIYVSGGTAKTVTQSTSTPYLWNNCTLTVSGNAIATAKEITLEINQNINGPHYLNGSRDIAAPILGNRDYTLGVTFDVDANLMDTLYSGLYKSNKVFNSVFDINADVSPTTSGHHIFFMSGCVITKFDIPSEAEGVCEATMEIRPRYIIGSFHDMVLKYNPW